MEKNLFDYQSAMKPFNDALENMDIESLEPWDPVNVIENPSSAEKTLSEVKTQIQRNQTTSRFKNSSVLQESA